MGQSNGLSTDQREAVDAISQEAGPFFLTGAAGSGKTFVINHLRDSVPDCVVTATTGMAAQLVSGRTLHSFALIIPRKGTIRSGQADERMRGTDLLIVDEASMMNDLLLDELWERFRMCGKTPKLVLVGDLLQLPPVEGELVVNNPRWDTFQKLKLTENHRQHEGPFIEVLRKIRGYRVDDQVRAFVAERTVAELPDGCTHLMAHRKKVERRNLEKLRELPGKPVIFDRIDEILPRGEGKKINFNRARFAMQLLLKPKARIVMLTNDPDGRWVNGSTGTVEEISGKHKTVLVALDSGEKVRVCTGREEILDGQGEALAVVQQLPMLLAWALTIHKSQGMTLDAVGVDLERHFAPGMTYVAMSRCRTAEGLYLSGRLGRLKPDPRILKYAREEKARQAEEE